ncbi:MAG: response regulator [Gammaproteobacteria bacterium]|nr:response regulator [Gammaproteobacteria bacterium]
MSNDIDLKRVRAVDILLVEDNEADVVLTQLAFKESKLLINMDTVEDGEKCMAYLRKQEPYGNAPTPDLILLDLNLPVMDGREVLSEILKDEALRKLPVVILTTSRSDSDLQAMYNLRCNSYITKPIDFEQFHRVVKSLCEYWFTVVTLPPKK